jgi:hypothetical protein
MVARLAARGIVASSRGNGLRVSFHAYNAESDVDAVLSALEAESPLLVRTGETAPRPATTSAESTVKSPRIN